MRMVHSKSVMINYSRFYVRGCFLAARRVALELNSLLCSFEIFEILIFLRHFTSG